MPLYSATLNRHGFSFQNFNSHSILCFISFHVQKVADNERKNICIYNRCTHALKHTYICVKYRYMVYIEWYVVKMHTCIVV